MKNVDYCHGKAAALPRAARWGRRLLALLGLLWLAGAGPAWAQNNNLDQIRNGAFSSRLDPPNWVNGNAGAQTAHYLEGHSIGYRLVLRNLTAGPHTVVIGWDVRDNGKNALDYISHYQNLLPHAQFGHAAETLDPLLGLNLGGAAVATAAIPAPAQIPAGPSFSFYQLQASGLEVMTMFNGTTLDDLHYVAQGDRTLAHAETQLSITFHTTQPTVVFAWGGHIASQADWGAGTSAASINGSPYHTRLISLDGSGGNQDRSMSADAVAQPPTCAFTGPSLGCTGQPLTFTGPAGMSAYQWTVTGGSASPSSGTGQSITVTASSSYTIQLVTTKSGLTSSGNCQQAITINPGTAATALTDLTRCPGEVATFTTTASGTGPFTYAWTKDGSPLAGATSPSYTVATVSAADAGTYAVTVTGACGSATSSATLQVNENAAATALTDLTRCPGEVATFTTTASGTGPFTYIWTKDGSPLAGATDPSYTIASASASDAGTYAVTVTGACGAATRSATLQVNENAAATALADLIRCPMETATFTTTASGTGPFTYAWAKDGITLTGATDPSYTVATVSAADAGTYTVTVTGTCGSATSSATLQVNENAAATALTDLTRCPGEAATFTTTASGTGPFTYAWAKDGITLTGATDPSYTIASASASDAGTYAVTVTGTCGSATRSATLQMNENAAAAALTSLTSCPGEVAIFTTTASGTGPFTYAWAKDGSPLAGATGPSYTVATVSAADAGTYAVTVTGACGSATRSATLQVNQATQATALTPLSQCDGTSATFATTASGTGPFTYAWTKNGSPLAGATSPSYTIAVLALGDAGTYAVTVTGTCGSATQSASLAVTSCLVQHCTLTQGGYGNGNGVICKYPGLRRNQLIANMLTSTDVVLGVPGRSLTYSRTAGTGLAAEAARLATAQCIIDRMPGGGTAAAFPNFGNINGCNPLPAAILKNGKFNNVLIGQTMALTLNLRLDADLGSVALSASMASYNALGCNGPDPADLTGITRTIPASVLGNLSYAGGSPTVDALLNLANRALGGATYANAGGTPSLADISTAASAINELFDNCRMYRNAPGLTSPALAAARSTSNQVPAADAPASALAAEALHAYPNPFAASTTLAFVLPREAHYQLLVFDTTGRQVAALGTGSAEAGMRYTFSLSGLQEGIYLARLVTDAGQQTVRLALVH